MLGFNDITTLVDHLVLSPREREKRHRRVNKGDEREVREERGPATRIADLAQLKANISLTSR